MIPIRTLKSESEEHFTEMVKDCALNLRWYLCDEFVNVHLLSLHGLRDSCKLLVISLHCEWGNENRKEGILFIKAEPENKKTFCCMGMLSVKKVHALSRYHKLDIPTRTKIATYD